MWEALYKFLDDKFVAHDGGKPAMAIAVPDCLIEVVSQDTLEEVLSAISQEKILPLKSTLDQINNQEMVVMNGDN